MVSLMVRRGNRRAGSEISGQSVIKLVQTIRRVLTAPAPIQPAAALPAAALPAEITQRWFVLAPGTC
jgi:hypothetical protein